ncbi:MAG: hypothetical protein KDA37_15130 [Planctomycetales bacterium]|nr:hypothetical protein [Planctomycetales bacterium]
MDFLNKYLDNLRDLFASMTPGARLTTGALLAVVVVSIGFLFKQSTSRGDAFLYGGKALSLQEVMDIQGAFAQANLSDYEVEGNMIRVPRSKQAAYLAAIADAGATPRNANSFLDEAVNNSSPFDNSFKQRHQVKAANERRLSHVISMMDWVQYASVMYDEREVRGIRHKTLYSATVNVKPKSGELLDSKRVRNLQRTVAGNFAGMTPDQVVVNNLNGDDVFTNSEVSPEDYETPYLREQARHEKRIQANVLTMLRHIPGVKVQVSVELDKMLSQTSSATRSEGPSVSLSEESRTETSRSNNTDGGARPGAVAQGPVRRGQNDVAPERKNSSETSVTTEKINSLPLVDQVVTETSGLVPKAMWASIEVPMDYVIGVWRQQQIATDGKAPELQNPEQIKLVKDEIITKIQNTVEPLMTDLAAGKDDFSQVKVVVVDTLPMEAVEEPSMAEHALFFASQYGNTLAMIGLAGFSLIMLRSMVRSGSGKDAPASASLRLETGAASGASDGADDGLDEQGRPKLRLKKPDTVKDDLADMVREDPDAAAAILSNWISNAS